MKSMRALGQRSAMALAVAGALAVAAPLAEARITRVEMQSPTLAFNGFSWPGVGQYEKIVGKAYAEVNPKDRRNAVIVDLDLADINDRRNVEYSFNFYILLPAAGEAGKGPQEELRP